MIKHKEYVVWYKSGAGGFFVAWLLQTAINPSLLPCALDVFPLSLTKDHKVWKQSESVPPDAAVLCNMFHPNTYYKIDFEKDTRCVIESVLNGNSDSIDTLLHCRIKFYLMNYVYLSGHITSQNLAEVAQHPEKFQLNDMEHVKSMTDILFDVSKNIFVSAPERYLELASQTKNCRYYPTPVHDIVANYPVKIFQMETTWQGTWESEVSKILGRPLLPTAKTACAELVNRYLEVMPPLLKEFCGVN
jgi:hypothetical protein